METGVAIVVARYLESKTDTITPISDRITLIKINGATPITMIGVYAPQSERPEWGGRSST